MVVQLLQSRLLKPKISGLRIASCFGDRWVSTCAIVGAWAETPTRIQPPDGRKSGADWQLACYEVGQPGLQLDSAR